MADRRPASWLPFVLVAMSLAAGTMGATMASPLYPLYEHAWGMAHSTTTIIYVVYMVGVMAAFLFLGRLCNSIDPVVVLRIALAMLLCGLVVCATAAGVVALGAGRALIGVASGMITTAATIGLLQLEPVVARGTEPGRPRHAPLVASMTTMAGFGLGPFVCGLAAQFLPAPLVLPYLLVLVPIAAILIGLCFVPTRRAAFTTGGISLWPRLGFPARAACPGFIVVSLATFSAYALFSLLASLAPSFLSTLLPWRGPAISGTAVAAVLFFSAAIQFPAQRLTPRRCLPLALGMMVLGVVLLACAMREGGTVLFVLADVAIGMGHGLAFMSGLVLVNMVARPEDHAGILASYFSIAYLGTIVPILAVGYLADAIGLSSAVVIFCLVFAVIGAALLSVSWLFLTPDRLKTG